MSEENDSIELRNLTEAGDWQLLLGSIAYKRLSRTGRIVMLRRALENREREFVRAYAVLISSSTDRAKDFHNKKIKPLWEYQDFLDRCMMHYEAGEANPGEPPGALRKLLE